MFYLRSCNCGELLEYLIIFVVIDINFYYNYELESANERSVVD